MTQALYQISSHDKIDVINGDEILLNVLYKHFVWHDLFKIMFTRKSDQ